MNFKIFLIFILLLSQLTAFSQVSCTLNKTDINGRKQGHWIKKYPDGHVQYEGYFEDNHPVGTFKRYYETDTLQSVLDFNKEGNEANALLFHSNGFIASAGKFINQNKEGTWRFFSAKTRDYLISEEEYKNNLRNGASLKYYTDNKPAEKLYYVNDLKNGEWIQYYPSGIICLKSNYINGKLDGSFNTYYEDGKQEYTGQYKNDLRTGNWKIYESNGNLKYNFDYVDGLISNPEIYKKVSENLDLFDKNKGKIADPEKTGTIW